MMAGRKETDDAKPMQTKLSGPQRNMPCGLPPVQAVCRLVRATAGGTATGEYHDRI